MIGMLVVLFAIMDDIAAEVSVTVVLVEVVLLVELVIATAIRWRMATSVPGAVTAEFPDSFRKQFVEPEAALG